MWGSRFCNLAWKRLRVGRGPLLLLLVVASITVEIYLTTHVTEYIHMVIHSSDTFLDLYFNSSDSYLRQLVLKVSSIRWHCMRTMLMQPLLETRVQCHTRAHGEKIYCSEEKRKVIVFHLYSKGYRLIVIC